MIRPVTVARLPSLLTLPVFERMRGTIESKPRDRVDRVGMANCANVHFRVVSVQITGNSAHNAIHLCHASVVAQEVSQAFWGRNRRGSRRLLVNKSISLTIAGPWGS